MPIVVIRDEREYVWPHPAYDDVKIYYKMPPRRTANRMLRQALGKDGQDADDSEIVLAIADDILEMMITRWEGIQDANGKPLPVSRDVFPYIDDVLLPFYDAYWRRTLQPLAEEDARNEEEEKNLNAASS